MTDEPDIIMEYDPNIFDIHRYYDNYVERGQLKPYIGNYEARATIALLFPLRRVSVVLKGASGSGKSMMVKCASQLIWGDKVLEDKIREVLYIGGSSAKGIITDSLANRIAYTCTHCIIPELQNAIVNNEVMEGIIKLWAEGENYPYKRADNGGRITHELTLKPLPVLTSLATENKYTERLGEEIERRFFPFYTVSSVDVNALVHKSKASVWSKCDDELITMTEEEKANLRFHMQTAMKMSGEYKIKNPSAVYMQSAIPHNFVVSNSMIGYWFELVAAVTVFNYPHRNSYTSKGGRNKYMLATPADNYIAWKLGGGPIVLASMNIPDMGREIIDIIPKRDGVTPDISIALDDIVDELHSKGIERTKKQVQQIMKALESVSYAKRDEYHKDDFYKTQDYDFDRSVDWRGCIDSTKKTVAENFPEIAKDYINDHCKDPMVIDPFTGMKIKLLDIKFDTKEEEKRAERRKPKKTIDLKDFGV